MLVGGGLMAAVVLAAGRALGPQAEADGPPAPTAADIVYLADPSGPALDPDRARADGVHVVTSARRLEMDSAEAPGVVGIVFDGRLASTLSTDWIAAQAGQGRVIVAIDLPMASLDALTGLHDLGPPDGFRQDWKGRSFFSLRYRSPEGANPRYSGRASDQVTSPEKVFQTVRTAVRPNRAPP